MSGEINTFKGLLDAARSLRAQIAQESRDDTGRFIEIAESGLNDLKEAETLLGYIQADFDATESETHPPGGEALAAALEDLKREAGL